jgi:hypothetical protein
MIKAVVVGGETTGFSRRACDGAVKRDRANAATIGKP